MLRRVLVCCLLITLKIGSSAQSSDLINQICSHYLSDKNQYEDGIKELLSSDRLNDEDRSIAYALNSCLFDPLQYKDSINYYLNLVESCNTDRCKGYYAAAKSRISYGQERGREAVDLALEAIHYLDAEDDQYFYMIMHHTAAITYYWMGDYNKSEKYITIALENALELDYPWSIAAAYDALANGYSGDDEMKADSFRQLYYNTIERIDDYKYEIYAYANMAWGLSNKDLDDSARVYFEKAFDLARENEDQSIQVEMLIYLAENSFWREEYQEAIQQYELMQTYPQEHIEDPGVIRAYDFWSQSYAGLGKYKEAYEYMRKYKETDDEYWDYTTKEKTAELDARYENLRKEAQLSEQQLKITQRTTQRNMAYIGGLSLLALGLFFLYRNRKNQKLTTSKIANLEKQQKLMALDYMVQGQEQERRRIAQDLHDGLGGILASAKLQINRVQEEIDKLSDINMFQKAQDMIDYAHNEVRRISHDMMPGALIDLGLIAAVEDLVEYVSSSSDTAVQLVDQSESIFLTEIQNVQLYRSIQELINNVIKHADASNIIVTFQKSGDQLNISVEDDGRGFDISNVQGDGIGISGVQNRIKYLNGLVTFEQANPGTIVNISIPITETLSMS